MRYVQEASVSTYADVTIVCGPVLTVTVKKNGKSLGEGRLVLDPDKQFQESVWLLFHTFCRTGAAHQTEALSNAKLAVPHEGQRRSEERGAHVDAAEHSSSCMHSAQSMVRRAYAFGRSRWRKLPNGKRRHEHKPPGEWLALPAPAWRGLPAQPPAHEERGPVHGDVVGLGYLRQLRLSRWDGPAEARRSAARDPLTEGQRTPPRRSSHCEHVVAVATTHLPDSQLAGSRQKASMPPHVSPSRRARTHWYSTPLSRQRPPPAQRSSPEHVPPTGITA
jgi:hypothetical protein